jgi:NADH-quinone oxidoreductase subunit N
MKDRIDLVRDLLLIGPAIVIFLASLVPITVKVLRGNREWSPFASMVVAFTSIAISIGLLVSPQGAQQAFFGLLVFDSLSHWLGAIVLVIAGATIFLGSENHATKGNLFSEYIFLVLNSSIGALILLWANDLMIVFIGLELMSLALYLLIALSKEGTFSKEAAFKYFVLGSFASAIFLFGVAFLFGTTNTTQLPQIAQMVDQLIDTNRLFVFGVAFVVLGFCFKVSVFPFHSWTPDVYQGAATPITAFMATAIKAVSFGAFLRIVINHGAWGSDGMVMAIQWMAVATMLVGNVAALVQTNLKRILAYSSVAHSGYAMVGLIVAGFSEGFSGSSGLVFYLITYSIMTFGAFAVISFIEKDENTSLELSDLSGIALRYPKLALAMTVLLLSLAGIPPTLGFFGKFYLFSAAVEEGLYWLAFWGVINSVIAIYYYLRPIVKMYMEEDLKLELPSARALTGFAIITCVTLILLFGAFSGPLFKAVVQSLASL